MTRTTSGESVRMRRDFGAATSGRVELSVYVPSTVIVDTYISLFQDSYSASPDRTIDLVLKPNGDLRNRESGGLVTIGSYNTGAWNDLEILWGNLPSINQYTLILNDAVVGSFPTERTGKTPARFEVKYGANNSDTGPASIYIDRVTVGGDDGRGAGGSYSFDLGQMIGSRSSSASDPSDGIALGETFSYEVDVQGLQLTVTIKRPGKADVAETITMNSGYNDDWMYFKAGVYNQNNSGDESDYVQTTFYDLVITHDQP
jgi:hypothetical protein